MVTPVAGHTKASPADAAVEKTHRHSASLNQPHGFRDGSKRDRKVWEHRKIAGAKPGEIVHHIDGNRANNAPENLHVFSSPSQHGAAHRSLELIAYQFLALGAVEFDSETGLYRLIESALQSSA